MPAETPLVRCGERQKALYLVLDGSCGVHLQAGASCHDLGVLEAGDWIGKQSFFDASHCGCADVITTCETSVLEVREEDFDALRRADLRAAAALVRVLVDSMASRLRATDELLEAEKAARPEMDEAGAAPKAWHKHLLTVALASLSGSRTEAR